MALRIYGLSTCDTCRKARSALSSAGFEPEFVDVRKTPPPRAWVARWVNAVGDAVLVNRRSATWRSLDDTERSASPVDLLVSHPTLMKRPLIEHDGQITVGWDDRIVKQYLG